ncbi:lipoprotein N-acyltransferase Lnb domain-containing protein [Pseudochryseolinea flava]|uniref:DUF4105 domain-containing protein n=1 Tax=Pseudochryseolinea flava TaxID=2059302 RepID=A0A364Y6S4_9BACT|nr:DUF4105 domain-containing protein [Pseudochryseolinea flava]RAW02806.1 hypothetical protein DQQ10_01475 [Pseudochryseolinea flava]
MKRILLFVLLSLPALSGAAQIKLSPTARISAITCGPGQEELYSAFGHSAFRVYDSTQRLDVVFNYGMFDFDQPHFYLNFTRGYLYYHVAAYDYRDFQYNYLARQRFIHEQVLNFTPEQNQRVFDYLVDNVQPGNESYRYDYFYNNCATKLRDVLIAVLGEEIEFDYSHIKTQYSIRDLTDLYIEKQQPWGDLGIDICLGLPMDKIATPFEYMFLPDYIESCFDHATLSRNGERVPLVKRKVDDTTLIRSEWEPEQSSLYIHPLTAMIVFMMVCIALSIFEIKRNKLTNWLDIILLVITGLIGLLLTILWFFTDHAAAAKNFNLLWAFPLNAVAAMFVRRSFNWLKFYFLFIAVIAMAAVVFYKLLPQEIHYVLIPLMIGISVRGFTQYWIRNKNAIKG